MIFVVGLQSLEKEQKTALIATGYALSPANLLLEKASQISLNVKDKALSTMSQLLMQFDRNAGKKLKAWNEKTRWNTSIVQDKYQAVINNLESMEEEQIDNILREEIYRLSGAGPETEMADAATALILKKGAELKVAVEEPFNLLEYEENVYRACFEEFVSLLIERIKQMSPSELRDLKRNVQEVIDGLDQAEKDAIMKYAQISDLTGQVLVNYLRNSSAAVLTQLMLGSTGFGIYLAITTVMKGLSLMVGVTFPFTAYITATSILSIILSGPFLLLVLAGLTGFTFHKTQEKVDEYLRSIYLVYGFSKARNL